MSKRGLLPRLAMRSIRKNASMYVPYLLACIFSVFVYFSFSSMIHNDIMKELPKAAYATSLMLVGQVLLGIILVPFLFYTNSFLMKRRKRELGLYNILGLEKRHLGLMLFLETLFIYVLVTGGGILLGVLFSRLIFLLMLNLTGLPVDLEFQFHMKSFTSTLQFFGFVSLLNLLVNLHAVGKVSSIELLQGSKKGEKKLKHVWVYSALGVGLLGLGYRISIRAQIDSMIFTNFFLAVFLVVCGTYFLFTSGSVAFLQFLKKRKKCYYHPQNFITISGMLYRMKKNAAGLVNICIFSTMVIITLVCTVTLLLDQEAMGRYVYPFDGILTLEAEADTEALGDYLDEKAKAYQVAVQERVYARYSTLYTMQEGNAFRIWTDADRMIDRDAIRIMTLADFTEQEGITKTLSENQVLFYSSGEDFGYAAVKFENLEFQVQEELQDMRIQSKEPKDTFGKTYYVVVKDDTVLQELTEAYGEQAEQKVLQYSFLLEGELENQKAFLTDLEENFGKEFGSVLRFEEYLGYREDFASTYGSLIFIGIFFGIIFTICLLLVLYYKQVTEGYEDQESFSIMQKVGMSNDEVKKTIRRQILLVFFMPLLGALVHTLAAETMISMLLGTIGMYHETVLWLSTLGVAFVFTCFYVGSYLWTAGSYYKIVMPKRC